MLNYFFRPSRLQNTLSGTLHPSANKRPSGVSHRPLRIEPLEDRSLLTVIGAASLAEGLVAVGIADSPPTPPVTLIQAAEASPSASAVILNNVPTSYWTYGCGATAAGMLFGYYDRIGYDNMYTGPTNGGVAPLTNLGQGDDPANPIAGSCSIIATQDGFDGRSTPGHVDDYWISDGSTGPDPWEATGIEHTWGGCTADFLGTNQWKWDTDVDGTINANKDGSTRFLYNTNGSKTYDPMPSEEAGYPRNTFCHGMRMFAESRGYFVDENYNQLTNNQHKNGFTFDHYMAEIDAGYPVIIHTFGHMMTGVGYDEASQTVYLHNTWGNTLASMTWGGSYAGANMRMVTVIHLESPSSQFDWGDAPGATYPTLMASDGARHVIRPTGPFLGTLPDAEADGLPSDDLDGKDDEDGVTFASPLVAGALASVNVLASHTGILNAWLDFSDDGDWTDPGEQIFTNIPVTTGVNSLSFPVPLTATVTDQTFSRFRLSTAAGLGAGGLAPDGEVEDYQVSITDQFGTIEGTQWLDLDADGIRDGGEPGLAGVHMFLDANDNGVFDEGERVTTTGSHGLYRFTSVPAGVQIVRQVAMSGVSQTYPGTDAGTYVGTAYRTGTNNVEVTTIDAATGKVTRSGVPLNVLLQGMVVTNDGRIFGINVNNDNFYEVDLQTLQVELVGSTGFQLHQAMAYDRQTDTIYGVARISSGSRRYFLVYDRATGAPIPLDDGSSMVAGVYSAAWDSANQRMIGFDDDYNKFYAFDAAGVATYLSTSSVDIGGRSMAHNGTYVVMQPYNADGNTTLAFFNPDTGAEVTPRLVLSEAAPMETLEFLPGTPYGHRVYVNPGETESHLDFGSSAAGTAEIRGTKWHDADGDGVRDPAEPGLEGATIFLDTNDNALLDVGELSVTTDVNGDYTFSGLPEGAQYTVVEVPQPGWYQTAPAFSLDMPAQPIAMDAHDLVYDSHRNILYGTTTGQVLRYDLGTRTMLSPLPVGNQEIYGADITPDGQYLYVAGGVDAECQVAKIDLDTGTVTAIPYTPQPSEGRPWDIVTTSAGYAIFTTRFSSSGWNPLRHISFSDDSVAITDAELSSHINGWVRHDTRIVRSEDFDVFYFAEADSSSGPTFTFDAFSGEYVGQRNMDFFVGNVPIAIDRDGRLAAINTAAIQVYETGLLTAQTSFGNSMWKGGLAFDPVRERFYYIDEDADCIRAYNSNTWSEEYQRTGFSDLSIGEYDNWNTGVVAFSGDGRFMFVSDDGHVDVFRMFAARSVVVTSGITADLDFGSQRNDFYVMEATPPEDSYMVRHSFTIDVRLNEDVDPASVVPDDATVGGIAATSVSITGNKLSFSFTDIPNGTHNFAVEAGAIQSVAGEPVAAFYHSINVLADDAVGFTSGTLLVVNFPAGTTDQISEYTLEGALVQNITINHGGDDLMRDIVVDSDRRIQGYAGTADPVLMTLQVASATTQNHSFAGWSTLPSGTYGGIAALRKFVFVTDMGNSPDPDGIVRFDTSDSSATRFAEGNDYVDLTIGHDGLLYALEGSTVVHAFDPYGLAELKTLTLSPTPGHRALAVDSQGSIFSAAWDGTVYQFDPSGTVINSLVTGVTNLADIDLRSDGKIVLTSRFGSVLVTDTTLSSVLHSFLVPAADFNQPFAAFSAPLEFAAADLTVTIVKQQIVENGGTSLVTVTRNTEPTDDLVVTLSAGPSGEVAIPASITIPAGHVSATFNLSAVNDAIYDGTTTVTITASAVGHSHGIDAIDVLDDETQPTVTLTVAPADIEEKGGVATFTATLSAATNLPVTVHLDFSGTAVLNDDYMSSDTQILISPLSLSGSLTVTVVDDTKPEGDETILVGIASVTNGTELGEQQATTTVKDDDRSLYLTGSAISDTIRVISGSVGSAFHQVIVNGTVTTYDPAIYDTIHIDGLGGNDTITIVGTGGTETVTLTPTSADVIGQAYQIHATGVEQITVDGAGGSDSVSITGSSGSNRLYSYSGYSRLIDSSRTFSHRVDGFETVNVAVPADGRHYAFLYDSPENDQLTASSAGIELDREDGSASRTASGFERVYAYATQGGHDTAVLNGSDTAQNRFYSYPDYSILTDSKSTFYFYAQKFDTVTANSPGNGYTYAYFYDSSDVDAFEATPASATMNRADSWSDATATGFNRIYAYSTRGGNDTATLTGAATGGNRYRAYPTYATLTDTGSSSYHYVRDFYSVTAIGSSSVTSGDLAYLYDSSGDDTYTAAFHDGLEYQGGLLTDAAATYANWIEYFDLVYARSSDRGTHDTIDVDTDLLAYNLIRSGTW